MKTKSDNAKHPYLKTVAYLSFCFEGKRKLMYPEVTNSKGTPSHLPVAYLGIVKERIILH